MILFICLFFPAVLAVWIYEALTKRKLGIKGWVYRFCFNATVINLFVFLVKKFVSHTSNELIALPGAEVVPEIAIRYLVMALPAAIVSGIVCAFASRYAKVEMEQKQDKENTKDKDGNE